MPIREINQAWVLETFRTAYAFGINRTGQLAHSYWGKRLPAESDYPASPESNGWASFNHPEQLIPEEYPAYAGMKFIDPCIKVTFADGVRDMVLEFEAANILTSAVPELVIHLKDSYYPLVLTLHYRLHESYDLIERWASLSNTGEQPILIERIASAQWHLPPNEHYRMTHLTGRWSDEFHLIRESLTQGIKILESRRLTTSHHHNPWFAVDPGNADETSGDVWFGALAWSGNWKISAEVTDFESTRITLGINDWDFAWQLKPGETFTTPASICGYTQNGLGRASRCLHDYIRDNLLPHGTQEHKILYNSWEATLFEVNEPSQSRLAEIAASLGIELFVVDDGWFKGRNHDRAGLGDWTPDAQKFPLGLQPLIEHVHHLGMQFGLWIEPEMVNPDSDLYRSHPDWVIHFPTRVRREARNQLILNFARTDVQEYIFAKLDQLLSVNAIRFIKWDMNRNISEPGWPGAPGDPRELWVRYVQGLYRVWGALRERHPQVIWQSCSGGGGRADLGILRLADQIWVSDNTEAVARLSIQEGFSHVFPASTMEAWVTDAGRDHVPLEFRLHVSMCGSLGFGGKLLDWSAEERREAARWIAVYKEIRPVIQFGDLYRLHSAQENPYSALMYMAKDRSEGVLFAFNVNSPERVQTPQIYPHGMDPAMNYTIEGFESVQLGQSWMSTGINIPLAELHSTVRRIHRIG